MSLRLLVDEDSQAKILVTLLRKDGHDVLTAGAAGLTGKRDVMVFAYAVREQRVILTHNCIDFRALHNAAPNHPGILCVYEYAEDSKNMTYSEVVRAIATIQKSEWNVAGDFVAVSNWNFEPPQAQKE